MKKYEQLNLEQRYQIQALLKTGIGKSKVAKILEVHPSTIYRELKRNTAKRGRTAGEYVATNAQRRTDKRHKSKPKQVFNRVHEKSYCRSVAPRKVEPRTHQ